MNVIRTMVALSACALFACGGANQEVRVQSTPVEPAAQHARTFAIGSSEQAPPKYRSSPKAVETARHIAPLLEAALRAKGYVPAASVADADLVWLYAAGRREVEKHPTPSNRESGDSYSEPTEEFEEGAVVIDALDKNGVRAWHGVGRTEVDPKKVDDVLLRKEIDQIMARFPNAAPAAASTPAAAPATAPAAPAPAK
jgi:hypothetical protein